MICNEICENFTDRVISWAPVAGAKDNKRNKTTYVPVSSSYMSIPSDQKSTALSWPWNEPIRHQCLCHVICLDQSEATITLLRMISGATYSGVPQKVQVFLPASMCFENPKSTIFMYPSLSETIVVH